MVIWEIRDEAMIVGTPVVTWPGAFMRGRFVASAYRQMKIEAAPIADNPGDYARLAIELGRTPAKRAALGAALRQSANEHLFMDLSVAREYEQFFIAAVASAGRNELLPAKWRPVPDSDVAEAPSVFKPDPTAGPRCP